MLHKLLALLLLTSTIACGTREAHSAESTGVLHPAYARFPVNSTIRAIQVLDENTLWYAGYMGHYGYTEDGGANWFQDSMVIEGKQPGFRSLVVTDEAVFLLTTESPALLFRSTDKGQNWEIVYREDHPDSYYNSMAFWDAQTGIAVGDEVEGCLSVIITRDGGQNWKKLPCDQLPPYIEGEGGYAASNTNIALQGDHVWIGTGGSRSRVWHSADRGQTWEAFQTPINEGGEMTGIYSVAFRDEQNGILFGGDWNNQAQNTRCKAITSDGGKTWRLLSDGQEPGYRSCVQYVPGTRGQEILAVGIPGISYSADGGDTWQALSDESFYTLRMSPTGHSAWLAGKNTIAKMTW